MTATESYAERDGSTMQEYGGFTVEYRDASHRYWIHRDDERLSVPSVTTVLKVLDKGGLLRWAEAKGAEGAARLARLGELEGVPDEEAIELVREFGFGADALRDAGASRGSLVHDMQHTYVMTGLPPKLSDFDPEHRGYVQGYCKFLIECQPEPAYCERIVGSYTNAFAGTLDMRARLTAPARKQDGRLARIDGLFDIKTNERGSVYVEHALQLLGYDVAHLESTGEEVEGLFVVALSAAGGFRVVPIYASAVEFVNVLCAWRSVQSLRKMLEAA